MCKEACEGSVGADIFCNGSLLQGFPTFYWGKDTSRSQLERDTDLMLQGMMRINVPLLYVPHYYQDIIYTRLLAVSAQYFLLSTDIHYIEKCIIRYCKDDQLSNLCLDGGLYS